MDGSNDRIKTKIFLIFDAFNRKLPETGKSTIYICRNLFKNRIIHLGILSVVYDTTIFWFYGVRKTTYTT